MEIYLSPTELHYFRCGEPCVAFENPPSIAVPDGVLFKKILIFKDEVVDRLLGGRIMVQKKY